MIRIRILIENDETGIALRTLLTEFQLEDDINDLLITLNSRYRRLRNENIKGTISKEEKDLELNRINSAILELLSESIELNKKNDTNSLRYYLYYSETKLNMLYSQISTKECSDYKKISSVEKALSQNNLIDNYPNHNKQFIQGKIKMNWGWMTEKEYATDIVFFGSKEGSKNLCLIGSRESLVGEVKVSGTSHSPDYYMFRIFNDQLANEKFYLTENPSANDEASNSWKKNIPKLLPIKTFNRFMNGVPNKKQELQFVAKIIRTFSDTENELIIATPIYVSYM